jgi:hypothetical protein
VTGLIYVILIAVWAVILVPRFLRHHDESRRQRESERLEAALSPQLAEDQHAGRASSWSEYLLSLTNLDRHSWIGQVRAPRSPAARRRRSISLALAASTGIAVLGAMVGLLPGFLALFFAVLLMGYFAAMFSQMRRIENRGATSTADSTPASAGVTHRRTEQRASSSSDGVRVVSAEDSEADSSWSPRETTLPTYVNKPKASRVPRRIDLTRQGWTGAGMVEAAKMHQASPELDEQFDREFSVVSPDEDQEVADYAYPEADDEGYYRRAANE